MIMCQIKSIRIPTSVSQTGLATQALETQQLGLKRRRVEEKPKEEQSSFSLDELYRQVTATGEVEKFPTIQWESDEEDEATIIALPVQPSRKRPRQGLFRSKSVKTGLNLLLEDGTNDLNGDTRSLTSYHVNTIEPEAEDETMMTFIKQSKSFPRQERSHFALAPISNDSNNGVASCHRPFLF